MWVIGLAVILPSPRADNRGGLRWFASVEER